MSKISRRKFSSAFKSKVCIEAIKEQQTIEALSKKYDLHPTQINTWKKEFLTNSQLTDEPLKLVTSEVSLFVKFSVW